VPGCEHGAQAEAAHLDDHVVVEREVVGVEHVGVGGGDAHVVAGVAHGGHGLDVVPVAVGLQDPAHAEGAAELQELLVLVGGVDEHGLARLPAAQDVHVVVHRSHHDAVDLGLVVEPVQRAHGASLPTGTPTGRAAPLALDRLVQ
jgi:hypothetical protein